MKFITLIIISFLTVSCSSDKARPSKNYAWEETEKLVKGKSTQKEIFETFGAPERGGKNT